MKKNGRLPAGVQRDMQDEVAPIEAYSSPKKNHTDGNAGTVFSSFVFAAAFIMVGCASYLVIGQVNIWVLVAALVAAMLAVSSFRVASEWERVVILRFGSYSRTVGPGPYFTIPFFDHIALKADLRMMLTGFGAEETLTSDLVPVNVDAVAFWTIWDPQKACLEVEDYYDSVSLAAQTALRDAIGRKDIDEVTMRRVQLDEELQEAIEEKTSPWGISVLSVEIRDVVIPKELQDAMSVQAKATREKEARIAFAEIEKDIASMLSEASSVYKDDEIAFKLRSMHLLNEGIKESKGSVVVPSPYSEGFANGANYPNQQNK